ncbi:MAG: hypothetical protein V1921_06405 [Candidatus Altiarchaeota archaeon]
MTGTKVIKLRLEQGGAAERLPDLKGDVKGKLVRIFNETDYFESDEGVSCYDRFVQQTEGLGAGQERIQDVLDFLLDDENAIDQVYRQKVGYLVSALIHNSRQREFRIRLKHPVDWVGYRLEGGKKITVDGDVAYGVGSEMRSGTIIVNGNSWLGAGFKMAGGNVIIRGNSGRLTGLEMTGGRLLIKGGAGDETGASMTGGVLHVKKDVGAETGIGMADGIINVGGDIKSISDDTGYGKIYHKGEKVRPR